MKNLELYKNIRRMAAALAAAAILAGCAKTEEEEPAYGSPLLVTASSSPTRAASPLSDQYSDFGVWAWKTDAESVQSLVLGRKPTALAGSEYYTRLTAEGAWSYEYSDASATQYLRYWDPAASSYHFSAYAPYTAGATPLNSSYTITAAPDGVCISGVNGNIPLSEGVDWLEASWKRQITPALIDIDLATDENHITSELKSVVQLVFHHILSVVEFRVFTDSGSDLNLKELTITLGAEHAVYTQADYAARSWSYIPASASTTLYSLPGALSVSAPDKGHSYSLTTLLQIPQSVTGRVVQVNALLSDDSERRGFFSFEEGWEPAKKYIYYLCIKSGEIILLDASAADWESGGEIEVTDPIVNW